MDITKVAPLAKDLIKDLSRFYAHLPIKRLNWDMREIKNKKLDYNCDIHVIQDPKCWYTMEDIEKVADIHKIFDGKLHNIHKYYYNSPNSHTVITGEDSLLVSLPTSFTDHARIIGIRYDEDDDYDSSLDIYVSNVEPKSIEEWTNLVITEAFTTIDSENICIVIHRRAAIEIIFPKDDDFDEKSALKLLEERCIAPVFFQEYYEELEDGYTNNQNTAAIHCIPNK